MQLIETLQDMENTQAIKTTEVIESMQFMVAIQTIDLKGHSGYSFSREY